jgi:Acetyltransferase (GNAT) domain
VQARLDMLSPSDPEWGQLLRLAPHDVYQLPAYNAFEAGTDGRRTTAFAYCEGGRVFLLPLLLDVIDGTTFLDATSAYGYSGPVSNSTDNAFWERATSALIEMLRVERVVTCFVRLHPLLPTDLAALAAFGWVPLHGLTVSIDLTLVEEQAWRQIRENHRRDIVRARKRGRRLVVDPWDELDDFIKMYHETMSRVGANAGYFFKRSYFYSLREALDEHMHLMLVEADGRFIGGGIFFEYGGIVQYHLGATHTEWLREQPSKLMFDEVRRWASARGNHVLHLGGGLGGQSSPENNGLFRFKAGFSDRRHMFHTWRVVIDEPVYEQLTRRSLSGTDPSTGYFPPYRNPSP